MGLLSNLIDNDTLKTFCPHCNCALNEDKILASMEEARNIGEYSYSCFMCGTPLKITVEIKDIELLEIEE